MKKIYVSVLTLVFASLNFQVAQAENGCPRGSTRKDKHSPCHVMTAKDRRNQKKHNDASTLNKNLTKLNVVPANAANNAINAYNKAISANAQDPVKIQATQTAAIAAINNLVSIYQAYLTTITAGTSPVTMVNTTVNAPKPNGTAMLGLSSCEDQSNATCDDGTVINTLTCADGKTKPDINGMCPDGSLVMCADGTTPLCNDWTSPMMNPAPAAPTNPTPTNTSTIQPIAVQSNQPATPIVQAQPIQSTPAMMPMAPQTNTSSSSNNNYMGTCDDNSTPSCYDGSTPDSSGNCADGYPVTCDDGTLPQ